MSPGVGGLEALGPSSCPRKSDQPVATGRSPDLRSKFTPGDQTEESSSGKGCQEKRALEVRGRAVVGWVGGV